MEDKLLGFRHKPLYRLLKVLYGAGWVLVVVIMILTFYLTKPTGSVIVSKSGFTCPDGKSYIWKTLNGFYVKTDTFLNIEDHISALKTCGLLKEVTFNKDKAREQGWTDQQIENYLSSSQSQTDQHQQEVSKAGESGLNPPYKLNWITDSKNYKKWGMAFIWAFVALLVANFLLDTIRNVVLYVAFGEPFSYPLLKFLYSSSKS